MHCAQRSFTAEIQSHEQTWPAASVAPAARTRRQLLQRSPSATVVVVVPTVSLVRQQCIAYEQAGFRAAAAVSSALAVGAGGGGGGAGGANAAPDAPAVDW